MAVQTIVHDLFTMKPHQALFSTDRPVLHIFSISVIALLIWRLWTFTILPSIDHRRPRQLPYWIPFIGHAFSFLRNPEGLLSFGREYFGNTRQPFAITVAGDTIYIVTSGENVTKTYNNRTTLSFDLLLLDMMKPFASPAIVKKMFQPTTSVSTNTRKSVVHLGHDWQVQQTRGEGLKVLDDRVTSFLQNNLVLSKVESWALGDEQSKGEVVVSCKRWSTETVVCAIQSAYFGDHLSAIDPELVQALLRFDSSTWQMFNHFPAFLTRKMDIEKARVVQSLREYFQTPPEKRPGEAWFVQTLENQYRMLGFTDSEIASLVMFTYWGINTNVSKMGFWTLARVVHDKDLMCNVRDETVMAFRNEILDVPYLTERCPVLNSIWLESLRLSAGLSSVRHITDDTVIGAKVLRRGDKVLISGRQLHLDEAVFGGDPFSFDPQRFLRNPKLEQHPSFRPFGGGATLCPGRILAKHAVFTFIALALQRFEIELATAQPFPRCEERNAGFGITMSNDDLLLRLKAKG